MAVIFIGAVCLCILTLKMTFVNAKTFELRSRFWRLKCKNGLMIFEKRANYPQKTLYLFLISVDFRFINRVFQL